MEIGRDPAPLAERDLIFGGRDAAGLRLAGGPLGLVQDGDWIELDVPGRRLHLDVAADELSRRRAAAVPFASRYTRGWEKLYVDHVMQADKGVDLDFLVGSSGPFVDKVSH